VSSQSDLISTATTYADEIGLANYICAEYMPGAPLPGDIVNYAARFDPDKMAECRANLEDMRAKYHEFRNGNYAKDLKDKWAGAGGESFQDRWAFLENHVANENDTDSVYSFFNDMLDGMKNVEVAATNLQKSCVHGIEGLGNLRAEYCKALAASTDDGATTLNTIIGYVGTGSGLGSAGGPHGIVAGAIIGFIAGMVVTFVEDVSAQSEVTLPGAPNLTNQMNDMELQLTGALDPGAYGLHDGITYYYPTESVSGEWEDV